MDEVPTWIIEFAETVEHFNARHADTVLLLARHGAGCPDAHDAELVGADAAGLVFDVASESQPRRTVRAEFDVVATSAEEAYDRLLGVLDAARAAAGDSVPLTSYERGLTTKATLPTFDAAILEVSDLTPRLRQLVIEVQGDLAAVHGRLGAEAFVYLFAGRDAVAVPAGYTMDEFMAAPPEARPRGAYYTVRHWESTRRRLTIWVVRHPEGDGIGRWVGACRAGERVGLWGPSLGPTVPADATSFLLVADETGLPAVAGLLTELPAGRPVEVIVEVADAEHVVDLSTAAAHRISWIFRGEDPPGTGTRLLDAVGAAGRPGDQPVVWGAGESRQMTAIRRLVRDQWRLPATHVFVTGYWRRD